MHLYDLSRFTLSCSSYCDAASRELRAAVYRFLALHDHALDPFGILFRIFKRSAVDYSFRVEHDQIGNRVNFNAAVAVELKSLCRKPPTSVARPVRAIADARRARNDRECAGRSRKREGEACRPAARPCIC